MTEKKYRKDGIDFVIPMRIQFKKQSFFEGDGLQQGVIKNNHTHGIKEGRNHKKVSSFFVLKNHRDCQYIKAMSYPSKVFGEKWGGNIFFITKNCRPGCAEK